MARPIQDSVVLFGDSITSRQDVPGSLHAKASEAFRRTLDVLNRGYGGYTTEKTFPLLDQFLARKEEAGKYSKIRLITIWLGTNDAVLKGQETNQHVPLPDFTANLHKVLDVLTSGETYPVIPNIILITPPPLLTAMMEPHMGPQREWDVSRKYAEAVVEVGKEWQTKGEKTGHKGWRVGYVDAWNGIIEDAGGKGEELRPYLSDGLHLSSEGYAVVWKDILKILKQDFKGRGVDPDDSVNLPYTVPDWFDIKDKSPQSVIDGMKGGYRR